MTIQTAVGAIERFRHTNSAVNTIRIAIVEKRVVKQNKNKSNIILSREWLWIVIRNRRISTTQFLTRANDGSKICAKRITAFRDSYLEERANGLSGARIVARKWLRCIAANLDLVFFCVKTNRIRLLLKEAKQRITKSCTWRAPRRLPGDLSARPETVVGMSCLMRT